MVITDTTEQLEAVHDDLSRSSFKDVNLTGSTYANVNLTDVSFEDACFNGVRLHNVTCIGMSIQDGDLSNVSISECNTDTMTINGILVKDLLACFEQCGEKPA
jgi:uncharacterized protein YjbI with pentapeptide repeats